MKNRYNLDEFRHKINLYLDNQLDQKEFEVLKNQVMKDPIVRNELSKEENFRKFVKSNVKRPTMPPDFADRIKNKLGE